jgi:hypothetical protein
MTGSDSRPELMDDFDSWARISAQMLRRPVADRANLLQDRGVVDDWPEADAHWYEVLVEDIEAGRLERVKVYAELCAEALQSPSANGQLPPSPIDELKAMVLAEGSDLGGDPGGNKL